MEKEKRWQIKAILLGYKSSLNLPLILDGIKSVQVHKCTHQEIIFYKENFTLNLAYYCSQLWIIQGDCEIA